MMEVVVILASMLTVANAIVTGYTREGVAQCSETAANYQMEFTLIPNNDTADVVYVAAWNSSSTGGGFFDASLYVECGSNQTNFFTFNATGQNEFQIVINVDKITLMADKPCGHTNEGLNFLWTFRTAKVEYAVLPSVDIWYEVPCNFSVSTRTQITSQALPITEPPFPIPTATDVSTSFALWVIDAANNPITMVNLGTPIKLQIIETGGDPSSVSGFSCYAGNNEAFDYQIILLDDSGCPVDPSIISAGFSPVTGELFFFPKKARTALFSVFRFASSSEIHFKCNVHFCVDDNNYLCEDLCNRGGPTGRKKRDVNGGRIIEASTKIIIVPFPVSYNPVTTVKDEAVPEEDSNCLSNTWIVATFASLGVLLIITIATAVFVCVRATRLPLDSQGQIGWSDKQKL